MNRAWFRSSRTVAALNILGVGLALAGATTPVIYPLVDRTRDSYGPAVLAVALPTLVVGIAWGALLRWPRRLPGTSLRFGWVLSVPLAALNAGVAFALLSVSLGGSSYRLRNVGEIASCFFMGATMGAILWVPALIATLVCFGVPLAWAERAAARGLSGEERGEIMVGLATTAIGGVGLALHIEVFTLALSLAGVLVGGAAAVLASARHRQRARFVSLVEQGQLRGFRVETTPKGRALVRESATGGGYRVGAIDEELFPLETAPPAARRSQRG